MASPVHGVLSAKQREAVEAPIGPVVVLAGAGSGKTRVLTHRIAHLVGAGSTPADSIFAVTFTNKAAAEMRERVARLLAAQGGAGERGPWISTFHSACVRILRREGEKVGLDRNFVIFDEGDQVSCLRAVLKAEGMDDKLSGARSILYALSRMKNRGEDPTAARAEPGTPWGERFGRVCALYAKAMEEAAALDFDDLLLWAVRLFRQRADVAERYAAGLCRHILVDEYQDTNPPQYDLLKILAGGHRSLFVVGDEDQSIYRWRGAEIRNLLDFERDFPDAQLVKLEENYRSTGWILKAANSVIVNNSERKGKVLWTRGAEGEKVLIHQARDERAEARFVVERCLGAASRGEASLGEIAIFYRTHAQSRVFEDNLVRMGVPYEIIGGTRFYERKEIRDALAYLKTIANPLDRVSLKRAIHAPPRGIGPVTIERVEGLEKEKGIPLLDAFREAARGEGRLQPAARASIREVVELLDSLAVLARTVGPERLLREVLARSGLREDIASEKTEEAEGRLGNLDELVAVAEEFEARNPGAGLQPFLDEMALVADVDTFEGEPNRIALMTLHSAKGLEFPVVFLTGMEEGLFPHARSLVHPGDIEEERRLCYVGMTRARRKLILSCAATRHFQGTQISAEPSRFLEEVAPETLAFHDWAARGGAHNQPSFFGRREETRWRDPGEPTLDLTSSQLPAWERGHPQHRPRTADRAREASRAVTTTPAGDPASYDGTIARPRRGPSAEGSGWRPGSRVGHPTFGEGVVRRVEGSGEEIKLTIYFRTVGEKKLMAKYASLTKLG